VTMVADRPTPDQKPYRSQGAMREVWGVVADEVMVSGPAGTGKSRGILEYLYALSLKYPGVRGLIVRQTRHSLTESALVTFETHVIPGRPSWVSNQQRRVRQSYSLPNGSEIVVGGLDNTARFMSTEFDWIYVQEAREIEESSWEDLTIRLRNGVLPFQMMIGDTNPDGPSHWILLRARTGKLRLIESRHEDNPVLFDARSQSYTDAGTIYLGRLDNLTGVRRKRLRGGLWVGAEGMVYDSWDPAVHVVEREIPLAWTRFCVVDFGFTNPFACLWLAEDHDGRLYVYRQVYGVHRLVRDWAHMIHELSGTETIVAYVTDHDLDARFDLEAHLGHSAAACGHAESWSVPTVAARKDVTTGIEAVSDRLRKAGDGEPRLYVIRDSLVGADQFLIEAKEPVCLEDEFPQYTWATARSQTAGVVTLEEPVKRRDHALDALRYGVMYLPWLHQRPMRSADVHMGGGRQAEHEAAFERLRQMPATVRR
jgi:PBSX family phage terminase large subunit